MKILIIFTLLFVVSLPAEARVLEFNVFLDDAKIGFHRFEISGADFGASEVQSQANFDVKFLFITAFKYRHLNAETWSNGCLESIEAHTNSNGKRTQVSGGVSSDGFVLDNGGGVRELPECIMSFAYWNPEFLEQKRLLNPQTGEYLDVSIESLGQVQTRVGNSDVEAAAYRISAHNVEVTVWYSLDLEWLALESPAKGGRTLRYELS